MVDAVRYRLSQFGLALWGKPDPADLEALQKVLTPRQYASFCRLQPSEQAHAILVWKKMQQGQGGTGRPLPQAVQAAALLHDVGKSRCPLRVWERVEIVLGKVLFASRARRWGERMQLETCPGWARPFVAAQQHPRWGAEIAAACGSDPLTIALIARHQEALQPADHSLEARWLALLQQADNDS